MSISNMRAKFQKRLRTIMWVLIVAVGIGMVAYFGGGPGPQGPGDSGSPDEVVVRVGGKELTRSGFEYAVGNRAQVLEIVWRQRLEVMAMALVRQTTLTEMIEALALADKANSEGIKLSKSKLRKELRARAEENQENRIRAAAEQLKLQDEQAAEADNGDSDKPAKKKTPAQEKAEMERYIAKARRLDKDWLESQGTTADRRLQKMIDTYHPGVFEVIWLTERLQEKITDPVKAKQSDVDLGFTTVQAKHILVGTDRRSDASAKQRAESVLDKLKSGEEFAKMAEEFSDDPGTSRAGGEIGPITVDSDLVPEVKQAALKLKKGEISKPVKSDYGYHIILVEDKTMNRPDDYSKNKKNYLDQATDRVKQENWDSYRSQVVRNAKPEILDIELRGYDYLNRAQEVATPGFPLRAEGEAETPEEKLLGKAAAEFEKALEEGGTPVTKVVLGGIYDRLGMTEEAIEQYNSALTETESLNLRMALADLYGRNGQIDEAVGQYTDVVEIYDQPDLTDQCAVLAAALGRQDAAEQFRQRAIERRVELGIPEPGTSGGTEGNVPIVEPTTPSEAAPPPATGATVPKPAKVEVPKEKPTSETVEPKSPDEEDTPKDEGGSENEEDSGGG